MANPNILVGIILAVFLLCAWWHIRENKALRRQLAKKSDTPSAQWMLHFAWSRTIQLLAVLGCCILIIITYNERIKDVSNRIDFLSESIAQKEALRKKQEALAAALPPAAAKPIVAAVPAAAPVVLTPLQAAKPAPATQSALDKALDKDKQTQTANAVDDVYNPEKSGTDAQSSMDDIKKRYEDILVIYMFLKKCGKVKPEDYNTITSALAQEMASVNAPGRMQYDILAAAKGSYKEIYSESACDGKGTEPLVTQYNDYIKILSTNFPPQ